MAAKPRARRSAAERGRRMTSLELPPDLLRRARIAAAERGLPFRAFVEQALRDALARKEDTR
jgi:predicted DNA binding CopG/RHH family protein